MAAYGDFAFGDEAYEGFIYYGTWKNQYTFTFEVGATVYITPTWTASIPGGTLAKLYCGQSEDDYTEMVIGERGYVLFENETSGPTNLYVKIEFTSMQKGLSPSISVLGLFIEQETTLYTITKQILVDGLNGLNTAHSIDQELQLYPIPYSWLKNMSHRKALGKCAEAAGGVCYQKRDGTIRVEAGTWIKRRQYDDPVAIIGDDRILSMESPVADVRNAVQITTRPYEAGANQVVWTASGDKDFEAGETITYTASFNFDAVTDCYSVLTGAGATIVSEVFYFKKAEITVHAASAVTIGLQIYGKPLSIVGSRVITETDGESVRRYGTKSLIIDENDLIQTPKIAELIAESAVDVLGEQLRNIEIDWRGDPTIELGDIVSIHSEKAAIVSQELEFDGTLKAKAKLRRV